MSEFTPENVEQLVEACRENASAIAEGLNLCFDLKKEVAIGESSPWDSENVPVEFDGPGLIVSFQVGENFLFALIPQTLPLPDWYLNPGDSESSRLQTLAMEWSMNLVPMDLEATEFASIAVENLKQSVLESSTEDWATNFNMEVTDEQGDSSQIVVVWPTKQAVIASEDPPDSNESSQNESTDEPSTQPKPVVEKRVEKKPVMRSRDLPTGIGRILSLPVNVVVCLAEKQIDMDHLLNLSPGGLISFNKSCEDYLDLYVNNHRYCRGEAVKIGEKFGLKIMEVGVVDEREDPIIHQEED